jgi:hypothetical protein
MLTLNFFRTILFEQLNLFSDLCLARPWPVDRGRVVVPAGRAQGRLHGAGHLGRQPPHRGRQQH